MLLNTYRPNRITLVTQLDIFIFISYDFTKPREKIFFHFSMFGCVWLTVCVVFTSWSQYSYRYFCINEIGNHLIVLSCFFLNKYKKCMSNKNTHLLRKNNFVI